MLFTIYFESYSITTLKEDDITRTVWCLAPLSAILYNVRTVGLQIKIK